ncbi:two-component regulator propeller domain-containing protein [Sphingobacterium sp. LRF_L2]|uniref:two-component regulator propeller domain-containing protein n=1 Tax=Sphingobacterium sp. LRF_L2 TaxID=3369421 RepID=UPI003F641108
MYRKLYLIATVLFAAFIFSSPVLYAQNSLSSSYTFRSLTIAKGLPINYVDDIYKDSKGFIWISTQGGGLSRYDGYECLNFDVNNKLLPLKSNFIRQVCEDHFGRLWLATDFGLDLIDLKTLKKLTIGQNNAVFQASVAKDWNNILLDSAGNIWLQNSTVIHRISFNNQGEIVAVGSTSLHKGTGVNTFTMIEEVGGKVYAGHNGKLVLMQVFPDRTLGIREISPLLDFGMNLFISSFVEMGHTWWIGTDHGLFGFDRKKNSLQRITNDLQPGHCLTQNMVTSLEKIGDHMLVVGTLKGLNFLDTDTYQVEQLTQGGNLSNGLTSNFVNCLFSDGRDLWVGTEAGGINMLFQRRLDIKNYGHTSSAMSLSPNPVNAILEDHQGDLWVGTVEGGLNYRKKGSSSFLHMLAGPNSITHNSVSALEEDGAHRLWVGTWGGGIAILDLDVFPKKSFHYLPSEIDYISVLKHDRLNNGMWIGTNKTILFYDSKTGHIQHPVDPALTKGLNGTIGCIIDDKNQLWIGTTKGLFILKLNTLKPDYSFCEVSLFKESDVKLDERFLHNITSIIQAHDRSIWISSKGYGVCRITEDDRGYHSTLFTTADGLVNNSCIGVLEDEAHLIWISTSNGISCYNPASRQFVNYNNTDGFANNQFYWNAAFRSVQSDKLYFGHIDGLAEIQTSSFHQSDENRRVLFTKLKVLNDMVGVVDGQFAVSDIAYTDQIELHERDKSFSVEFSALNFSHAGTTAYSYRLLGFDSTWVNVPADIRFAAYTNLGPGNYTLEVRYKKSNGEWSAHTSKLKIIVHPYFYRTTWFILLVIVLLLLGIFQFIRWRLKELENQRQMLHEKVELRTRELALQTVVLEEQAQKLTLQNQKLSVQNEKISKQRKELVRMSKKVQEAMAHSTSFFTNITHEFRTPITLINGPLERAIKMCNEPKVKEQLSFISRNARYLLTLVNQIMDFRKIESEALQIVYRPENIRDFFQEIIEQFQLYAQEKEITIRQFTHLHQSTIYIDKEAIRKVLTNLLANAVKFSHNGGTISVYLSTFTQMSSGSVMLYLAVADDGIGIKDEDLENVFERFYRSSTSWNNSSSTHTGTGIGLFLCKKIMDLMNGKIFALNNFQGGATFRAILPLPSVLSLPQGGLEMDTEEVVVEDCVTEMGDTPPKNNTILLVEDNQDMRRYLRSILEEQYQVVDAENGQEALLLLKQKEIDFVVSDLMMPVMDGMRFSKILKHDIELSHIPVLLLTAKTGKQVQLDSYKIGADEILFKPFDEEVLLTRIQNILAIRRGYQQKFSVEMKVEELHIPHESKDNQFLKRAMGLVQEHYKNPNYEIVDFIRALGVSKTLANAKLQHLTGYSPNLLIRNYRLTVAKKMLLENNSDLTISQIAYEVGFNDPKYFTRCFTKQYGKSPTEFLGELLRKEPEG